MLFLFATFIVGFAANNTLNAAEGMSATSVHNVSKNSDSSSKSTKDDKENKSTKEKSSLNELNEKGIVNFATNFNKLDEKGIDNFATILNKLGKDVPAANFATILNKLGKDGLGNLTNGLNNKSFDLSSFADEINNLEAKEEMKIFMKDSEYH